MVWWKERTPLYSVQCIAIICSLSAGFFKIQEDMEARSACSKQHLHSSGYCRSCDGSYYPGKMLMTKLGTVEAFNLLLQFSKERQVMDNSPEKLKKELEEELQLSSEDLRSHAWYHGRIPRQVCYSLSFCCQQCTELS